MVLSAQLQLYWQIAVLSLFSAVGIVYGTDRLVEELHFREGPGSGPVLALIKEATGIVQRERASHYSWREAGVGDGFYRRESLQTGVMCFMSLYLVW